MIKNIKCFLLIFVVLGFLQLETSAMEDERGDRNATLIRLAYRGIIDWSEETNNKVNALTRENENLRKKVNALQEQLNPSRPVKAIFKHSDAKWKPYVTTGFAPVTFNLFEGDERLKGNLSTIEIPEDGVYSLFATYCWKANANGSAMPCTAISIDNPGNVICLVQHHLAPGFSEKSILNRVTHLNKGNKVMVSIFGQPNAEHFLACFQFEIEKLH